MLPALSKSKGRGFRWRTSSSTAHIVGRAGDPNATLSLLPVCAAAPVSYGAVMTNNLEILGQFMYPADAYRRLLDLLRSGLLDIRPIRPRVFPLTALPEAMEAAAGSGQS
jgi:alcohol dehydrogenase